MLPLKIMPDSKGPRLESAFVPIKESIKHAEDKWTKVRVKRYKSVENKKLSLLPVITDNSSKVLKQKFNDVKVEILDQL